MVLNQHDQEVVIRPLQRDSGSEPSATRPHPRSFLIYWKHPILSYPILALRSDTDGQPGSGLGHSHTEPVTLTHSHHVISMPPVQSSGLASQGGSYSTASKGGGGRGDQSLVRAPPYITHSRVLQDDSLHLREREQPDKVPLTSQLLAMQEVVD